MFGSVPAAVPVGELIFEADGTRETAAFTYHESWLALERAFPISPDMPLGAAPFLRPPGKVKRSALLIAMTDTAPDSWGRKIHELLRGTQYLTELDYLLESDDRLRIGALPLFRLVSGRRATATCPTRARMA